MTLVSDGLLDWAGRAPDRPAAIVGGRGRRYGELAAAARQVAAGVAAGAPYRPGGGAGPRIGLLLNTGMPFMEIFLGTVLAGGTAMVLDPHWSDRQLRRVLDELPPDLLFAEAALLPRLGDAAGRVAVVAVGGNGEGAGSGGPGSGSDAGPAAYAAWRAGQPAERTALSEGADADAASFYIGFTSGTTGAPKALTRTHRSWVASFAAGAAEYGIGPKDRILVLGSLVHSMPLFHAVEGIFAGATIHLLESFDAGTTLDRLAAQPFTVLTAVPTLLKALADAAGSGSRNCTFPSLRAVISSGAKLEPALQGRLAALFPAAETIEYYGASELSFVSIARAREGCPPDSVGRPVRGVTVAIRRADGSEAAVGEVGQVFVRSAMVSLGYLRPGDGTGFRLEDGWATVGDRAWRDAAGFLHLVGREQDMMITGGLNVYPAEVEAVLRAMPEIADAVVLGVPDPDWGDLVCAVLRWQGAARLGRAALQERCRAVLERHKTPRRFFAVAEFPWTASGKIARGALRDRIIGAAGPALAEIP